MKSAAVRQFVFDTMADWEAVYAVPSTSNLQFQFVPGHCRVITVGARRETVTAIEEVSVQPRVACGLRASMSPKRLWFWKPSRYTSLACLTIE